MAGANTFPHVILAQTVSDMASIHVSELDFGAICFVASVNSDFTLTATPNSPPDGVTVVSPVPQAAVGKPGAAWEKGSGGGGGTEFLEGVTLAQLATITGADANTLLFVFDTESFYRWFPADETPQNGFTVVAAPGGNWHLEGTEVYLSSKGGGADDWPTVIGFANALSYVGTVHLRGATFLCKTVVPLTSGVHIVGDPGTLIVSSLPDSGIGPAGSLHSVFFATKTILPGATTLASGATPGDLTVSVVANTIVADSYVSITHGAGIAQSFKVLAVGGPGPFTLTLDAPVEFTFSPADAVQTIAMATDVLIDGEGMEITGTGDRAVELVFAERSLVRDVFVSRRAGSFTAAGCSFNIGGRQNRFERITVDGGSVSFVCISLESQVGSAIVDCTAYDTLNAGSTFGVYLPSVKRCTVERTRVWSATNGIWAGFSNAVDEIESCVHLRISNCDVSNCFNNGIDIVGGSDVTIEGTSCRYNMESGISISNTPAGGVPRLFCANVDVSDNKVISTVGGGLYVHGATSRLRFANVAAHRNSEGGGLYVDGAGGTVIGTNLACDDGNYAVGIFADGCQVRVGGFQFRRVARNATWIGVFLGGASTASISKGTFEIVGGSGTSSVGQPSVAGATIEIEDAATVGAVNFGVYAAFAVANVVIRGLNVNFNSVTVAAQRWVTDASTLANFGKFTANGATPVVVPGFFAADQAIVISLSTAGGTPGAEPTITAKSANSFTVIGTSLDTSVYDWKAA